MIKNNSIQDDEFVSASLALLGSNVFDVSENVFSNPTFDAEIFFRLPTASSDLRFEFSSNYFGFEDHESSLRRVRQSGFDPGVFSDDVNINPFYTSEDLDIVNTGVFDGTQVLFDSSGVLSGVLKTSLTLLPQEIYTVQSGLVIDDDVTLTVSEGTHLEMLPASSILVRGKLEFDSTAVDPAYVTSTTRDRTGVLPVQLINGNENEGVLQIFDGTDWGYVCDLTFDMKIADVVCRQMQLGSGLKYYVITNLTLKLF